MHDTQCVLHACNGEPLGRLSNQVSAPYPGRRGVLRYYGMFIPSVYSSLFHCSELSHSRMALQWSKVSAKKHTAVKVQSVAGMYTVRLAQQADSTQWHTHAPFDPPLLTTCTPLKEGYSHFSLNSAWKAPG